MVRDTVAGPYLLFDKMTAQCHLDLLETVLQDCLNRRLSLKAHVEASARRSSSTWGAYPAMVERDISR
jgi:hypothetical protein